MSPLAPIRMAQYGTKHGHAAGKLAAMLANPRVDVAGIYEPDRVRRAELQSAQGAYARVMSAIRINELCEDYVRRRAIRHLEKGRIVILAAGTGNPFFTTDSAACLRGIEINADVVLKATKVDGVYSADPMKDPDAELYTHLSYDEVLAKGLAVMDATAIALCRDQSMPVRVFNMGKPGALMNIMKGEAEGTLVE